VERTLETWARHWRRHLTPTGWGVETTLETWRLGSGHDAGDLAVGRWRRHWRHGGWGSETALETWGLGIGDDSGDLAAGEWRLLGWGLERLRCTLSR